MVQLKKLLPLDILYQASHDAGSVGGLWSEHHRAFAKFIMRYSPRSVFEIGGGHGILAKECKKIGDVGWMILEPNPPSAISESGAKYTKGFFDADYTFNDPFDAVVHSHVFEHMYDVMSFTDKLRGFLEQDKMLFFSLPNMLAMLKEKYTNAINFEHTFLLAEEYVEFLMIEHGFAIENKEYFLDNHSIFYACRRSQAGRQAGISPILYDRNKELFFKYIRHYEEVVEDLNERIQNTGSPIYLFGAHVFSQYLIEFGLRTGRIVSILDNAPAKQGKRLYGTNLMVRSPNVLRDERSPIVILRAGAYNEEIKSDILGNINPSAEFWM
jgi:hypothetical protein